MSNSNDLVFFVWPGDKNNIVHASTMLTTTTAVFVSCVFRLFFMLLWFILGKIFFFEKEATAFFKNSDQDKGGVSHYSLDSNKFSTLTTDNWVSTVVKNVVFLKKNQTEDMIFFHNRKILIWITVFLAIYHSPL